MYKEWLETADGGVVDIRHIISLGIQYTGSGHDVYVHLTSGPSVILAKGFATHQDAKKYIQKWAKALSGTPE